MIKLEINGVETPFEYWKFPAGEIGVKVDNFVKFDDKIKVSILGLVDSNDLITLYQLFDIFGMVDEVYIPYVPYARQDRICHEGESFSLNVFLSLLLSNHQYFKKLTIVDPHSQVCVELIEDYMPLTKLKVIEQHECTTNLPKFDFILAPDKGALEKSKLTQPEVPHIFLSKTRTPEGIIYDDYEYDTLSGNICVVDDIADSCGTFLAIAKMLIKTQPNMQSLNLYVTHGIFSKNCIFPVKLNYDNVYCYNLMNLDVDHMVEVIK